MPWSVSRATTTRGRSRSRVMKLLRRVIFIGCSGCESSRLTTETQRHRAESGAPQGKVPVGATHGAPVVRRVGEERSRSRVRSRGRPMGRPYGFSTPARLPIADADDFVGLGAARSGDLDRVAGLLADQSARKRRGDREAALVDVGLLGADDLIGRFLIVIDVRERDLGAELDRLA